MTPNNIVTNNTTHIYRLFKSAHNKVLIAIATRIKAPPIVGVPDLLKCDCGPSSRITWPICLKLKRRIIVGPTIKAMPKAVITPRIALSVRY